MDPVLDDDDDEDGLKAEESAANAEALCVGPPSLDLQIKKVQLI